MGVLTALVALSTNDPRSETGGLPYPEPAKDPPDAPAKDPADALAEDDAIPDPLLLPVHALLLGPGIELNRGSL